MDDKDGPISTSAQYFKSPDERKRINARLIIRAVTSRIVMCDIGVETVQATCKAVEAKYRHGG